MTRSQIIQFLQQNTVLIVVFASMGLSALQWILRKLGEQRQLNEARRREAAKQYEALRTGRATAPPSPTDQGAPLPRPATARDELRRRMEILARQKQLEELRRRQQAAGRAPTPPQIPQRTARQPGQTVARFPGAGPTSSGPIVAPPPRAPRPKGAKQQIRRTAQQRKQAGAPAKASVPDGVSTPRKGDVTRSLPVTLGQGDEYETAVRHVHPDREPDAAVRPATAPGAKGQPGPGEHPKSSAEQWRRTVALLEALAPPLCLRGPDPSGEPAHAF